MMTWQCTHLKHDLGRVVLRLVLVEDGHELLRGAASVSVLRRPGPDVLLGFLRVRSRVLLLVSCTRRD